MIGYEVFKVERVVDRNKIYDNVKDEKRLFKIFTNKEKAEKYIEEHWHPEYYYELGKEVDID